VEGTYGLDEEEIQEISEFDEDLGYLKTRMFLESMKSKDLIDIIEKDPQHDTFHQYGTSTGLLCAQIPVIVLLSSFIIIGGVTRLFEPSEFLEVSLALGGIMLLFVLCGAGRYYLEKRTQYIVANERGIGWKEYSVAIEWDHVQWVDIGIKKEKIDRVIFSGNRRQIWVDNYLISTEITLADIYKYLPDLERWEKSPMQGWPDRFTRYRNPEI
jgi:hypothetical protein